MRLIHKVPFSPQEIESYRQLTFDNLTGGLKCILDAMDDMGLKVSEDNIECIDNIDSARYLKDGEPFPVEYLVPLKALWHDPGICAAWERGNEAALPEKYVLLLLFYTIFLQTVAWNIFSQILIAYLIPSISRLSRISYIAGFGRLESPRRCFFFGNASLPWSTSAARSLNGENGYTVFRMWPVSCSSSV